MATALPEKKTPIPMMMMMKVCVLLTGEYRVMCPMPDLLKTYNVDIFKRQSSVSSFNNPEFST